MEEQKVRYLVFDIESVPDGALIRRVKYPDENLTDDEAIDKLKKEILTITDGSSDFIPVTFHLPLTVVVAKLDDQYRLIELISLDEPNFRAEEIARKFWYGLEVLYRDATLVTFNGRGFDVPLLELMAYRFGFSAKKHFSDKGGTRYRYGQRHIDLQEALSNHHAIKMAGGLNLLAKVIGRPGKMDTKGSEVHELWRQGRLGEINDYCFCDVLDTYFVFLRYRLLAGDINGVQEKELWKQARAYLEEQAARRPVFRKYIDNSVWD
jgi:3'-5' exonuclease